MDRPVQLVLLLVAIFSLGLNDFFDKNPFAKSGNAQAVTIAPSKVSETYGTYSSNFYQTASFNTNLNPGLQIIDFQANRTTFGFLDFDFTQPFDPDFANKKVALGCDSVEISLLAVVSGVTVSDSLGFKIKYGNPDGSTVSNELFLFDNGQVTFSNGATNFSCNIGSSATSVSSLAGVKTLDFNLNPCLTGLGISLQPGDTMRFLGKFAVNPNGPLSPQFKAVPNFSGFAYATQNGLPLACDTLFEDFTVAKSEVIFDFPNTINGLPKGCNSGSLNWRLFVPNNDFTAWFGNELRPATKIDSLVFDFDPGLLNAFSGGEVEVSLPGHPVHGSSYYSIRPLSDFPDGHYVALFDTLTTVPTLNFVQTYTFDLRLKLTPTCESPTGSIQGNNIYGIQSAISYTDRFYANFIGDGSCVNVQSDEATSTVAYNQAPNFVVAPTTPAATQTVNGIATWDLLLCNTSQQTSSENGFLALEDPSGLLTVTELLDVTDASNPISMTLVPYGPNAFAFLPTVTPLQCLKLRVSATTTSCDDVPLKVLAGWECDPFPQNWTPDDHAPCSSASTTLSILNGGASPIQVIFANVTSSCNGNGEQMDISGSIASTSTLPSDAYALSFVWDENGDGIAQPTETILAQQSVTGAVTPSNPLNFNQLIQVQAVQACQLLVFVETGGNSACSSLTAAVPVPSFQNAGAAQTFCDFSSLFTTTLGGGTPCDTASYHFKWSAIAPASNAELSDTSNANPILTIDPMNYLGQILQYVLATERVGCGILTYDTISIVVPNSANGVFAEDSMTFQLPNCQSMASVCAEISSVVFPNFVFTENGQNYTSGFTACAGGFSLVAGPGVHEFVALDTISGCADTVLVTVNCTLTDVLQVGLELGESDTICLSSSELSGSIVSVVNLCQDGQFVDYQWLNDSCLVLTGSLVGQENACLLACDGNGFCDTTLLEITVSHPFQNGITDTITLTQLGQFCFDENQLNLVGTLSSIQNICPNSSGSAVQFMVDSTGFCVDYLAVGTGTESACLELCDDLGNCDTVNLTVTVVPGSVILDTVFLLLETDTFCLPQGLLPGALASVTDICHENNGDNVNFTIQGDCILYKGFAIGADTACFRFEDVFGNVALFELIISVRKTTPNTFCDTIFVGQSKLYCLDVSELPGDFENGSLEEICPDERTNNVELTINQTENCVYYVGQSEGIDSSCIIFCDEFGFCDTTYFCFLVKPYFDPPTLGADSDTTLKGTPIVIDFLANDTIYGGIEDIYVLDQPAVGTVVLNLDNSFTFIPDDRYCDYTETFSYVACNPNGCDTTTVSIYIKCIELTIFTAVSPNNDRVNDVFYIAKIEDFPDNHLWVYNIWGSLVYETMAYRNNWPGTWGNDTDLPDGTYYFILEWTDNGVTTVQKGYMELFR